MQRAQETARRKCEALYAEADARDCAEEAGGRVLGPLAADIE